MELFCNGVDAANTLFDNLLTEPYAAFDLSERTQIMGILSGRQM